MQVVVTGGAGFIGSHLVETLVERGHALLVVDNLSTGRLDNLAAVRRQITFESLDVRDRAACERAVRQWRAEAVVHLAAVASPVLSIEEPALVHDVNLGGTFNVLEAARSSGARRFIFPGSAAVYGPQPSLPSRETDPVNPISPYAAQKLAGELLARAYRAVWGLETVSLRLFNVFGERQPPGSAYSGVLSIFAASLLSAGRATIMGDGKQSRDFIYVGDVVRSIVRAVDGPDPGFGPFNVGCGESLSVRRLYSLLAAKIGVDDAPLFAPERPGDVRHSQAEITPLRQQLGIWPEVSVEAGIDRLLAWLAVYRE